MTYETRVLTGDEIQRAVDWAAAEGWNPGQQDASCFQTVDPQGFWGGFLHGEMIACISVVNYDPQFAFLGFYITKPDYRGQGYGFALWQAAMAHAGDRVVGLDGVPAEQENYRRSGFELAWQNVRYGGTVPKMPDGAVETRMLNAPDETFEQLDASVFPARRRGFWLRWLSAPGHHARSAWRAGRMVGFGVIRPCRNGWKVGPLVADDKDAAQSLMADLLTATGEAAPEVFLDLPLPNTKAKAMAEELGLVPVFDTARMYKGAAPVVSIDRIFGVTSYELG